MLTGLRRHSAGATRIAMSPSSFATALTIAGAAVLCLSAGAHAVPTSSAWQLPYDATKAEVVAAMAAFAPTVAPPQISPAHTAGGSSPSCGTAPSPPPADALNPMPASLKQVLDSIAGQLETMFTDTLKAQAGTCAIVSNQTTLWSGGFGSTRTVTDPTGHNATGDTVFRIGSVTKVFTTLMLKALQAQGIVSQDDPVSKYVPAYNPAVPTDKGAMPGADAAAWTTLRELASHMGGLPRYSPCTFGNCSITLDEAVQRMNSWTLKHYPGEVPDYSNVGFSLLGYALASAAAQAESTAAAPAPAGDTWASWMQANVFAKLGMANSSNAPPADASKMAHAYQSDGSQVPLYDLGFEAPAGQTFSSANDMARLIKLVFRDHAGLDRGATPDQLIGGNDVRSWVNDRSYDNADPVEPGYVEFTSWGVPWEVYRVSQAAPTMASFPRYPLITKDGSVPGYEAMLMMQPDMKLGFFCAMAESGESGSGANFDGSVVLTLGYELMPKLVAALQALAPPPAVPAQPHAFDGMYNGTGQFVGVAMEAKWDDKGRALMVQQIPGMKAPMAATWLGGSAFEMGPARDSTGCLGLQTGMGYVLGFEGAGGSGEDTVTRAVLQGFNVYPAEFERTGGV